MTDEQYRELRQNILQWINSRLKPKRFQHTLGVEETAIILARINGYDPQNASIAALLHDNAKNLSDEVLYKIADLLAVTPEFPLMNEEEKEEGVLYKFEAEAPAFIVRNLGNHQWKLEGERIEKLFNMTDFANENNVYRFGSTLRKMGVDQALRDAGCIDGDLIFIKDYSFEFVEQLYAHYEEDSQVMIIFFLVFDVLW